MLIISQRTAVRICSIFRWNSRANSSSRAIAFSGLMPMMASLSRVTSSRERLMLRRPALSAMRTKKCIDSTMTPPTMIEIVASCHDTAKATTMLITVWMALEM